MNRLTIGGGKGSGRKGVVLVETLLLVSYVMAPLFLSHVMIIRKLGSRLRQVEAKRLKYDGASLWKPF